MNESGDSNFKRQKKFAFVFEFCIYCVFFSLPDTNDDDAAEDDAAAEDEADDDDEEFALTGCETK